jgi:hypothetical protein
MLTKNDFERILEDVQYRDWYIDVVELGAPQSQWCAPPPVALRVRFVEGQVHDEREWQTGRKWYLSPYMTKSEVVLTALKAVLTAEEHEARERFRYKGRRIAGPHLDVDALADMAGSLNNLDLRSEAETNADRFEERR